MHFYERNIVEIKNEYTNFLINIITPFVYEGIKSIYERALMMEKKFKESSLKDPSVQNPGILKIFQMYLKDTPNLNSHMIKTETDRIKEKSKCSDWFDDLLKATVKSNIILLTFNASGKKCKLVKEKYHKDIKTELFIHNCYIECARIFYNYPELFYHKYSTIDIKRNQREAYLLIRQAISEAIRKMLPMKLILDEYLKNDYIDDDNDITKNVPESKYTNLRSLVKRDILDEDDDGVEYDENVSEIDEKTGGTENKSQHSSQSKYANSYNKILESENTDDSDDTDDEDGVEKKINDIDDQVTKIENIETNDDDLIYGKNDTVSQLTVEEQQNNEKTNIEQQINEQHQEQLNKEKQEMEQKMRQEEGMKYLESIKKPKNMMNDMLEEYKRTLAQPTQSVQPAQPAQPVQPIQITQPPQIAGQKSNEPIHIKINNKVDKNNINLTETQQSKYFDNLMGRN